MVYDFLTSGPPLIQACADLLKASPVLPAAMKLPANGQADRSLPQPRSPRYGGVGGLAQSRPFRPLKNVQTSLTPCGSPVPFGRRTA